jgi:glutamate-1-semialdehyde 2,1-aminomutase
MTSDYRIEEMWGKYNRAKELIPGGSGTMSKAPNREKHPHAPALIVRGEGCRVWDAAGRCFIDFRNALGPITLGYSNEQVKDAIRKQLDNGIVFGHPSPLEGELAEKLVRLIPCAEQVRYLKTGGEAMGAALRLARAYTQRPVILSCGYHGWINNTATGKGGNPPEFAKLGRFLPWNNIAAFEQAIAEVGAENVAAISVAMPYADIYPNHPFYGQLRALADRIGALLIYDEIVTGFRVRIGGAQEFFNVIPDLAVFSKGVAAGMPLSVFCGRADVMAYAASIPVSSTFSGETLSLAAALATVDIYENQGVIDHLWARGEQLIKGLNEIFTRHAFPMQVKGLPPCAAWSVGGENWNAVGQTHSQSASSIMDAFIDACYANGVSLYTVLYPNFAHTEADIAEALERIDKAVSSVKLD